MELKFEVQAKIKRPLVMFLMLYTILKNSAAISQQVVQVVHSMKEKK